MVYVFADDLTGANDTGVQFVKKGYKSIVVFENTEQVNLKNESQTKQYDAIVIDTETRNAEPSEARMQIRNIVGKLDYKPEDTIYKKIDSTLKGNIGAEIDEIMKLLKRDICILAPSFPANNRIVIDGKMIIRDNVNKSGLDENIDGIVIEHLFTQLNQPTLKISIRDINKGKESLLKRISKASDNGIKIFIIDATCDEHLLKIYQCSRMFRGSILYAGSAGLASQFNHIHKIEEPSISTVPHEFIETNIGRNNCIVINGSRNSISLNQTIFLHNEICAPEILIDIKDIVCNKANEGIQNNIIKAKAIFKLENILIVRTSPIYHTEDLLKDYPSNSMKYREIEKKVWEFIGKLILGIYKTCNIQNLISIGGDTTFGVCRALGISSFFIAGEILPGIPLVFGYCYNQRIVRIVTKAGGFGDIRSIYHVVKYLGIIDN